MICRAGISGLTLGNPFQRSCIQTNGAIVQQQEKEAANSSQLLRDPQSLHQHDNQVGPQSGLMLWAMAFNRIQRASRSLPHLFHIISLCSMPFISGKGGQLS
jgi:hypothetical protein